MAPTAFWKGYLKFSLVTCPVALTPATSENAKVRFHTLNKATGRRVRSTYVDAETGDVVDDRDQVKGYESQEGRFVTFEDEELESVALESVRTIDIDQFAPAGSVPWVFYDSAYYVTPNDKVGEEAYAVIRDAMARKKVVGISRVVLFRRERAVMLQPRDGGIVLWTLRYGDEVRAPDAYFAEIDRDRPDPKLLAMISRLIEERTRPWDGSMVHDPVQDKLKELIAQRRKKAVKAPARRSGEESATGGSNVVNLLDALKQSIERAARKPKGTEGG